MLVSAASIVGGTCRCNAIASADIFSLAASPSNILSPRLPASALALAHRPPPLDLDAGRGDGFMRELCRKEIAENGGVATGN